MEILASSRHGRRIVVAALIAAAPAMATADVTLRKVPALTVEQAPAYPDNLARYNMGAQVTAVPTSRPIAELRLSTNSDDANAAEAALLCDDPTVGYALPAGKTTILVSLPKVENVSKIAFHNASAKGELTIATSNAKLPADSSQWNTAVQQPLATDAVQAPVGPSEAKYLRLTFEVSEPGRIYGFGIFSSPQISDFTVPRSRKWPAQDQSDSFALISYNLTDIHAKARALYVSSGDDRKQANNVIDGQTATTYNFGSADSTPTTVIDLGKVSTLRRLATSYAPRAGSMQFYVLQALPVGKGTESGNGDATDNGQSAPETLALDEAEFAKLKAVGVVTDDGSRGRAAVDFPATSGRYVLLRWLPAAQQDQSFALAEVSAFGKSGNQNTILAANTQVGDEEVEGQITDGKTMLDGKTLLDAKDMPAEGPAEDAPQSPAEGPPPTLPQPPPFTFVPVLVPISP